MSINPDQKAALLYTVQERKRKIEQFISTDPPTLDVLKALILGSCAITILQTVNPAALLLVEKLIEEEYRKKPSKIITLKGNENGTSTS